MTLPTRRTLILIGALVAFVGTAAAQSSDAHSSKSAPLPRLIAAGNLPGCLQGTLTKPAPLMRSFHATVLRVVVNSPYPGSPREGTLPENGAQGQALPCVKAARREGYKVMLVIQWNSEWSPARVRQFFSSVLRSYGSYLWAVGVGNEQEISPRLSGYRYSLDWKAVEPLLKRMVPHAIRVGGEISPWGLGFLEAALRAGLPGMQALAVHPYAYKWEFTIPQVLQLAHRYRVALWCDEGLYEGPESWRPTDPPGAKFMPLSSLRGAVLAGVWDRV
jgi:hypothetical protein